MMEQRYKPELYEGRDPYIHVSFHPHDRERVMDILQRLNRRGFRFWLNDGIAPGMETDEIIAEHIAGCEFFLAFLSEAYLSCLDTRDELNFSRDENKAYLLVYLEDTALPAGLDMRFLRAQSIPAYSLDAEAVFEKLTRIPGADRFYGIADENLREAAARIFGALEKLYPEHKVFALDAVNKQLSREVSELYVKAGYPSAERLLQDYGFSSVSTRDARALRSSVLYQPGFEPETVKPRIEYIVNTLTSDFPNRVITEPLAKRHKAIYSSLLGISTWLGYESAAMMLEAYGFTGFTSEAGRIAIDENKVISQLQQRYEGREKPTGITRLIAQNPDMKGNLKTLTNRAYELFGKSLLQHLKGIGLIVPREGEEVSSVAALRRKEIAADIRCLYESPDMTYGTFREAEEMLKKLLLKKNSRSQIYVFSGSECEETVKIPYGVSYIAREAFLGEDDLVTLILPSTVKEIREAAFSDCTGLRTLVLPEGLERIGNNAFAGCTSLQKVVFPASLKLIGNEAFSGCELLSQAEFGNMRTSVQEDAFEGCAYTLEELQDRDASPAEFFRLQVDRKNNARLLAYTGDEEVVVIPQQIGGHPIVSLEKGCFKGNTQVREVYISDRIGALSGDVFKDCVNLQKVHISESVTKLTATAFAGCTALREINIPDAMPEVPRGLFRDSPLTTLYIGKSAKRISPDAFCKGTMDMAGNYHKQRVLQSLIVDAGNPHYSAVGTTLLSRDGKVLAAELGDPVKAVIPEGVEEIAPGAFEKLSSLQEVSLPESLLTIGEKAFAETRLVQVEIPKGCRVIGDQAFYFCKSLAGLELYDGLQSIGSQAFAGCPAEDVYIPASVETLGANCFRVFSPQPDAFSQRFRIDPANRQLLTDEVCLYQKREEGLVLSVAYASCLRRRFSEEPRPFAYGVLPGTAAIADRAFANCNNLSAVELPDSLRSIGNSAFAGCSLLAQLSIPEGCEVAPTALMNTPAMRV